MAGTLVWCLFGQTAGREAHTDRDGTDVRELKRRSTRSGTMRNGRQTLGLSLAPGSNKITVRYQTMPLPKLVPPLIHVGVCPSSEAK